MTQTEFIKSYCEKSNISEENLNKKGLFCVPCDCNEDSCQGWAMEGRATLENHVRQYVITDNRTKTEKSNLKVV